MSFGNGLDSAQKSMPQWSLVVLDRVIVSVSSLSPVVDGALTVSVYCCMVMYYVWLYCCTDWCIHTVYETTCVVTLTDVLLMYFDVF